jgi:hypothetical protein
VRAFEDYFVSLQDSSVLVVLLFAPMELGVMSAFACELS